MNYFSNATDLKIVGIVCAKDGSNATTLTTGVAYTKELTDYIYEKECEIYPHWIDVNNHLNNAHYLDLASEFLSGRVNTEENAEEIEIMYKHEILPGDKIKCMLSETEETYTVVCKNAVPSQLHAIIIFHKKAKK